MTSSPTSTRHSPPPRAAEGLRVGEELPPPVPALFPARALRERLDDRLTRELAGAAERIARGSVMPTLDMAGFRRELAGFDFRDPRPLEPLLEWTIAQLEHGVTHMTHPRYLDRKSTRLNSSHDQISYAVFCLKKKKKNKRTS